MDAPFRRKKSVPSGFLFICFSDEIAFGVYYAYFWALPNYFVLHHVKNLILKQGKFYPLKIIFEKSFYNEFRIRLSTDYLQELFYNL